MDHQVLLAIKSAAWVTLIARRTIAATCRTSDAHRAGRVARQLGSCSGDRKGVGIGVMRQLKIAASKHDDTATQRSATATAAAAAK